MRCNMIVNTADMLGRKGRLSSTNLPNNKIFQYMKIYICNVRVKSKKFKLYYHGLVGILNIIIRRNHVSIAQSGLRDGRGWSLNKKNIKIFMANQWDKNKFKCNNNTNIPAPVKDPQHPSMMSHNSAGAHYPHLVSADHQQQSMGLEDQGNTDPNPLA